MRDWNGGRGTLREGYFYVGLIKFVFCFLFGLPRKEELKTRRKKDTEEENNLHHNLNP